MWSSPLGFLVFWSHPQYHLLCILYLKKKYYLVYTLVDLFLFIFYAYWLFEICQTNSTWRVTLYSQYEKFNVTNIRIKYPWLTFEPPTFARQLYLHFSPTCTWYIVLNFTFHFVLWYKERINLKLKRCYICISILKLLHNYRYQEIWYNYEKQNNVLTPETNISNFGKIWSSAILSFDITLLRKE